MRQIIHYRRIFLTDCSAANPDFQDLFRIFTATLKPDLPFRKFRAYYYSTRLHYIDVTFIILEGKIIGFCAAAFYDTVINGTQYTIGRAATGILEPYRQHRLPKWQLYGKYIRYWISHPFRRILLSAYVANPLIYAMICKYTGIAYPRPGARPPAAIRALKDRILQSQNLQDKEEPEFVVEIHFCVQIGEKELERIHTSKSKAVRYFLSINPKFRERHGVLVLIPVTLHNILLSSCKFAVYGILKLWKAYLSKIPYFAVAPLKR